MAIYDGSCTFTGSGTLTLGDGVRARDGAILIQGEATLPPPTGGLFLLGSVKFPGQSSMYLAFEDGSATMAGQAVVTAAGSRIISGGAFFQGDSQVLLQWPLFIHGRSQMQIVQDVVEKGATTEVSKPVFGWRQLFQRGDLQLFLCDQNGPFHPVSIRYEMFYIRPDGSRQAAGPRIRYPARGRLGEFYVTGYAGEFGQPGNWVIKWSFQRNFYDPLDFVEQCFRVEDAVLRANPADVTPRTTINHGWS